MRTTSHIQSRFVAPCISLCVALNLLLATSGLPIVWHFCGSEIDSVSFVNVDGKTDTKAERCEECPQKDDCPEQQPTCCHDELHIDKLQTEFLQTDKHVLTSLHLVVAAFVCAGHNLPILSQQAPMLAALDKPPPRTQDIPVLFCSFLI